MSVRRVEIQQIRNLELVELDCHPDLNVLFGINGSGKTSALESLYLLSRGRSFRTSNTDSLINNEARAGSVFARLESGHRLGLTRSRSKKPELRIDGNGQNNWDLAAHMLPILVLDAGTFSLLEGGPKARRQFMDWGVFHVEQGFIGHWRRFRKSLANRNQLLKAQKVPDDELRAWNREFVESGEQIDLARSVYLQGFSPLFEEVYFQLAGPDSPPVAITYSRGWDLDLGLSEALDKSFELDRRYKSTQTGPQRADLIIKSGQRLALDVLSRGQQKILISALKIAQGRFHDRLTDNKTIYLVDDLPAELDKKNRMAVLESIACSGGQLFVTCVEPEALQAELMSGKDFASFHVERGKISAIE